MIRGYDVKDEEAQILHAWSLGILDAWDVLEKPLLSWVAAWSRHLGGCWLVGWFAGWLDGRLAGWPVRLAGLASRACWLVRFHRFQGSEVTTRCCGIVGHRDPTPRETFRSQLNDWLDGWLGWQSSWMVVWLVGWLAGLIS